MRAAEPAITELQRRVDGHPADRYPVQHATAQFHLGVALAREQRWSAAEQALRVAATMFEGRLGIEHAKARNMLGAVLRSMGRGDEALEQFEQAAAMFGEQGLPLEEGAAAHNAGLCLRDQGRLAAAKAMFVRARRLLPEDVATPQAAAATRELGTTLLLSGDHEEAVTILEDAADLGRRGGDSQGVAAATNLLGLALLAIDRVDDAAEAFRTSVGASGRAVRPEAYATAKANLALALERAGDTRRARLAAEQALSPSAAPEAARQVARQVLDRLGRRAGAVTAVITSEPGDTWPVMLREELARWLDADDRTLRAETGAWVTLVGAESERRDRLADAWLSALLELPTESMERIVGGTLEAWGSTEDAVRHHFRGAISRAMRSFHEPQWLRMKDTFNRIASELGHSPEWG